MRNTTTITHEERGTRAILSDLFSCAISWEDHIRLLGNNTATDIATACVVSISALDALDAAEARAVEAERQRDRLADKLAEVSFAWNQRRRESEIDRLPERAGNWLAWAAQKDGAE